MLEPTAGALLGQRIGAPLCLFFVFLPKLQQEGSTDRSAGHAPLPRRRRPRLPVLSGASHPSLIPSTRSLGMLSQCPAQATPAVPWSKALRCLGWCSLPPPPHHPPRRPAAPPGHVRRQRAHRRSSARRRSLPACAGMRFSRWRKQRMRTAARPRRARSAAGNPGPLSTASARVTWAVAWGGVGGLNQFNWPAQHKGRRTDCGQHQRGRYGPGAGRAKKPRYKKKR